MLHANQKFSHSSPFLETFSNIREGKGVKGRVGLGQERADGHKKEIKVFDMCRLMAGGATITSPNLPLLWCLLILSSRMGMPASKP